MTTTRNDVRSLRRIIDALPPEGREAMRLVLAAREAEYEFARATGANRPGRKSTRRPRKQARMADARTARMAHEARGGLPETDQAAMDRLVAAGFVRFPEPRTGPEMAVLLRRDGASLISARTPRPLGRGYLGGQGAWPAATEEELHGVPGYIPRWRVQPHDTDLSADREARAIRVMAQDGPSWRRGRRNIKAGADSHNPIKRTPALRRFRITDPDRVRPDRTPSTSRLLKQLDSLAPEIAALLRAGGVTA